jgi:lipopolysaccharide/colanic/teichoic acid biosynthesis glycosyltransferase
LNTTISFFNLNKGIIDLKRLFDLILSIFGLLVLTPLLLVLMLMIRLKIGTPIFFIQERPGFCGAIFKMVKFRTMTNECNFDGSLMADAARLTAFGKFLRSSSLDELPELWNVLKGDMSLVGPRPLLVEYMPYYTTEQARRHEVRPGITGWAQVNGRNAISWEEKFKYDVWYVDNQSFWLDVKILWMTVLKVIHRSDITQDGHATMEKFSGSVAREAE